MYVRYSHPNSTRYETILSSLLHGQVVSYGSGLAAFNGLLTYFRPNIIAVGIGYHGSHEVIKIHEKLYGLKKVDMFDEATWETANLGKGNIVHLETPVNSNGMALNIASFAAKAHARGAILTVDSLFGPPGLQDPFVYGADVVMHSGSKYIGGHSDILAGLLATQNAEGREGLAKERSYLGSVMGNFEGWLGVRSLRTLDLRVQRASSNAETLVKWLSSSTRKGDNGVVGKVVDRVELASLQESDLADGWLKKQMPNGYGPVFALWMHRSGDARRVPGLLKLYHHAMSLGCVESLVEWRWMSDEGVDPRLLRFSVGIENVEDLKADLGNALRILAEDQN